MPVSANDSTRSFHQPARAAVIGASGGIGSALVDLLQSDERFSHCLQLSRSADMTAGEEGIHYPVDLTSENSIAQSALEFANDGPLDLVFVTTGLLHRGEDLRPEKSMATLTSASMQALFSVNTAGPLLVAKHFLPLMRRHSKTVFAVLSARVGSIEDNRLGGWLSYRISKAALNMGIRTLSIEQARKNSHSIVVSLHPGTVNTRLSEPFSGNVPDEQLFSPAQSAAYMMQVVENLAGDDTGGFYAWDGKQIPY